ncbi:hypothetical protein ACQ4M3_24585 [Leptolyngbya sp. AN03gr2]|uniref:hypothetical protein n=1 Tax=unclassified Leptolyngbya TaxID=2650499 RepID=UPI003D322192
MTENDFNTNQEKILEGVRAAIAQAIERHRRLGESIAVWKDGKVVILEANQILPLQPKSDR